MPEPSDTPPVVVRRDFRHGVVFILVGVVLTPFYIASIRSGPFDAGAVLLVCMLLCIFGFSIWWLLSTRKPLLVVEDAGVSSPSGGWGPIPWSEVREAFVRKTHLSRGGGETWLCFVVEAPERWFDRKPSALRKLDTTVLGLPPTNVNIAVSSIDPDLLLAAVARRIPERVSWTRTPSGEGDRRVGTKGGEAGAV